MENDNVCIVCGEPIPEGRQICPHCEKNIYVSIDNSPTIHMPSDPLEDIKDELEKTKKETQKLRTDFYSISIAFAIIFVIHLYMIFG